MSFLISIGAAAIAHLSVPSAEAAASGATSSATLPSGASSEFRRDLLGWQERTSPQPIETVERPRPHAGVAGASKLKISSPFGWRHDPINGDGRRHEGVDLPGRAGSEVKATGAGIVRVAGWVRGYGNLVEIDHGAGVETRYGHLERIRVAEGQRVAAGQQIGDLGSTGRSTGPHVHYEVRVKGQPADPTAFMGRPEAHSIYPTVWARDLQVTPKWIGWSAGVGGEGLPESRIR